MRPFQRLCGLVMRLLDGIAAAIPEGAVPPPLAHVFRAEPGDWRRGYIVPVNSGGLYPTIDGLNGFVRGFYKGGTTGSQQYDACLRMGGIVATGNPYQVVSGTGQTVTAYPALIILSHHGREVPRWIVRVCGDVAQPLRVTETLVGPWLLDAENDYIVTGNPRVLAGCGD